MKGYRFKLESALRVRRIQEEMTRARLAKARIALEEAKEATVGRRNLLDRARGAAVPASSSPNDWQVRRDRQDRLAVALRAAQAAEAHAFDLVSGHRDQWAQAAADLKVLERLDDRAREQWREDQLKAEQKDLDELSAAREARRGGSEVTQR